MLTSRQLAGFLVAAALSGGVCRADLEALALLDGASGYEGSVLAYVRKHAGGRQEVDNTGSLTVAFGSGSPHTLLIAGLDEPGYAVSGITEDGYLRVQHLSAAAIRNLENFFLAQPVRVATASGKVLNGIVSALSVHLQSERESSARIDHAEEFFVDLGARSRAETGQAGVGLLDPVTLDKAVTPLGQDRISAPWISGRAGAAILLALARRMAERPPSGAVTLAFVSQQYSGHRGMARIAERVNADRVIWIKPGGDPKPGIAPAVDGETAMADRLAEAATRSALEFDLDRAGRIVLPAFAKETVWKDPGRVASLSLGVENADTPVEVVTRPLLDRIATLLAGVSGISGGPIRLRAPDPAPPDPPPATTLERLISVYGVSGRETAVREAIQSLLPDWARRASRVDSKGNLIVALGENPERLFIAHMDELGYEVTDVSTDGRLRAGSRGGGTSDFYEWHSGFLRTSSGLQPAILVGGGFTGGPHIETGGPAQKGDTYAARKRLRPLLGRRVTARTLDDRVGCSALLDALRSLKREEIQRPVWFVFSVEEEIGLKGAEFLAETVHPREVYPIDTFVSSDSPLENPRMANARLGGGFVIRAMDSSGMTPRSAVMRVVDLARKNKILVQVGITSGANDGSKFVPGGAVNIPLGWPLRYSHSPAETGDLGDIDALTRIIRALAIE